jgi:drug/metabolite transporter (DMT)-like permease
VSDLLLGCLLAFLSALGFATHYFLIRAGFRAGDPDGGAFVSTISSTLLLGAAAIVALALQPGMSLEPAGLAWFAAAGAFGPFAGRVLLYAAIHRIGGVRSSAIANSGPLITVFLAVVLLGEQLTPGALGAVLLVVAGIGMLAWEAFQGTTVISVIPERASVAAVSPAGLAGGRGRFMPGPRLSPELERRLTTTAVVGLLAALVAAVGFSVGRTSQRVGLMQLSDPFVGAAVASGTALVMQVALLVAQRRFRAVIRSTVRQARPAIWLAGALAAFAFFAFFAALTLAPLSTVAIVSACESVLAVIVGALTMRRAEGITPRAAVAACFIFAAGVLVAVSH